MRCSFCRHPVDYTGPLCMEPVPYAPNETQLVCKACTKGSEAFAAEMKVIAEDAKDWADHLEACDFCHSNKSLLPRGPLGQACLEYRKAREAIAREAAEVTA